MKFDIDLTEETLTTKELTVKQYKEMLKAIWPETPPPKMAMRALGEMFSELTDKSISYFYNLNVLDVFLFLLFLRVQALGGECKLTIEDTKSTTVSLNLIKAQQSVREVLDNTELFDTICSEGVEVKLGLPKIKNLLEKKVLDEDNHLLFLKEMSIPAKNQSIEISDTSLANNIFNTLSPKISQQIIERANKIKEEINNINFFDGYSLTQTLPLFLAIDCILWYAKLFFSEPLNVLYDNLFYLAHLGNINLEYIERCTPGEYTYLVSKLEFTLKSKQQSSDSSSESSPEDGLSDEEGLE
jgi:hypothetical protein